MNMASSRLVYTPMEIKELLGVSKTEVYKLINSGEMHIIRIGRKILVPKQSFNEWLYRNK